MFSDTLRIMELDMLQLSMMKNESDLYPYSVSYLSLRDAIVISPHPDDESIGCGGSIVKHIKAGVADVL
jgi:hypothetical protein